MVRYVKCPRCELNYIDEETQEYCDVCLAEMHGDRLQFADLDEEELEELDAELEQTELCPVCGVNSIRYGEKMCESCKQENPEYDEEDEEIDIDKDEEWKNYLDEDDSDLTVDNDTLEEELEEELEEDSEETYDDDFFDDDLEPLDDLDDDEDEDDEDFDDDDF